MNTQSHDAPPSTSRQQIRTTLRVAGMTCRHSEMAVKNEVGTIAGVTEVRGDAHSGIVTVFSNRTLGRGALAAAIAQAGFTLL